MKKALTKITVTKIALSVDISKLDSKIAHYVMFSELSQAMNLTRIPEDDFSLPQIAFITYKYKRVIIL